MYFILFLACAATTPLTISSLRLEDTDIEPHSGASTVSETLRENTYYRVSFSQHYCERNGTLCDKPEYTIDSHYHLTVEKMTALRAGLQEVGSLHLLPQEESQGLLQLTSSTGLDCRGQDLHMATFLAFTVNERGSNLETVFENRYALSAQQAHDMETDLKTFVENHRQKVEEGLATSLEPHSFSLSPTDLPSESSHQSLPDSRSRESA